MVGFALLENRSWPVELLTHEELILMVSLIIFTDLICYRTRTRAY